MKKRLDPEYRTSMRELVGGFIQHCEISKNLVGRIDRFIEYNGRKYGLPVFNFYGPYDPKLDTRFIGLLANNKGAEKSASETLFQLLERLILQPTFASGLVLSVLPVTNPVALELGEFAPDAADLPELAEHLESFVARAMDGIAHVGVEDVERPHIDAQGPLYLREAAAFACETINRLSRESGPGGFECRLALQHSSDSQPWALYLTAPRAWSEQTTTHWLSQFLIVFLRGRVEALRRHNAAVSKWDEYATL